MSRAALILCALLLAGGAGAESPRVDPSTLTGKLIFGYQGWFACPGDAAGRGWVHWRDAKGFTVDMLPDVGELPAAERCDAGLRAADGEEVFVYSAQDPATVDRHFAWMERYGIDGVALQRFSSVLVDPKVRASADRVLANVRAAAEKHGRVFFLMYDLSGATAERLALVREDWRRLEADGLTASPSYLRHRGHPALGLWGLGFAGKPMTPDEARAFLREISEASQAFGGVTTVGGVPAQWRTGTGSASADPGWKDVWPMLQVISPWAVGSYRDDASADRYLVETLEPDLAEARRLGADLMPVVFPGFTWANLMRARHDERQAISNQIPRRCGRFWWRQVVGAVRAGATTIFGAMFDEVDEGTAMFKIAARAKESPTAPSFVTLDADGCKLPSDFYLR
ncbi:MAG: glycoside hydrolase family 71/99-like protein, partial [Roseiarcus sp.]